MLDLAKGVREAARAGGVPFEGVLRALDDIEPADLEGAFKKAAQRYLQLSKQAACGRAENIELDRLDSGLGFLLGANGLVARGGRLLRLLQAVVHGEELVRQGSFSRLPEVVLTLRALAGELADSARLAEALTGLERLLLSLARLESWGKLRRHLYPGRWAQAALSEAVELVRQTGGAAGFSALAALCRGWPPGQQGALVLQLLCLSVYLSLCRLGELGGEELRLIAACLRESLAAEAGAA